MVNPEPPSLLEGFLARWSNAAASERANAQLFLTELTDVLGVPRPGNDHAEGYTFEFPVSVATGPGAQTEGRIDLYRRGSFVLEAKQFVAPRREPTVTALPLVLDSSSKKRSGPLRGSDAWDDAMWRAKGQAERYSRSLPDGHEPAPFLLVVDVGHSIEIYADFTQAGRAYQAFPDPRSFRMRLDDLRSEAVRERLRRIWLDPLSLDPAEISAEVTQEIAGYLAALASSLEAAGHAPRLVAEFLTRCLFCMFAEDVGLLPQDGFHGLLESLRESPIGFVPKLRTLFNEMQTGTDYSVILNRKLLRFNGGLFEDASVLPLDESQLNILIKAAQMQWKDVEPAIFGTLLERALDSDERHRLGAHYTPRSYVERLVLPAVIDPLRAEWDNVRAAALVHAQRGDLPKARAEITRFHNRLCEVTVLDPACGSGNFLYVTLEHLKRLEGEVLDVAAGFGENLLLDLATHSVDPHQFLGIELNPRAASIAELVLWIGYLQWHFRTRGNSMPAEPVLKKFRNIECRDAVLLSDGDPLPARDEDDELVTSWDRKSFRRDPVSGREVPDETSRVPLLVYANARPAEWPKSDYVVGNPPFIGNKRMREALGSGYTEALRAAYPSVPETADFVMYWWEKAATLAEKGAVQRFGLITTNSLKMVFNRRVVQAHLGALSLVFAVPDHPWVDTSDGADVRIAMTVAEPGTHPGLLRQVITEEPRDDGSASVLLSEVQGHISADLTVGADVAGAVPLMANHGICFQGMNLVGEGFRVTEEEAASLGHNPKKPLSVIRRYQKGRELLQGGDSGLVIDAFGMSAEELRAVFPAVYQHLLIRVKPERDQNNRQSRKRNWWLFGEPVGKLRSATKGLRRYIATVETSKFKPFVFVEADVVPDHKLYAIALDDAFVLGVLSSRIHQTWALAAGGRLGVGNDPTWTNTTCFLPFPFPSCGEPTQSRIRTLGEELDAHRKRVLAQHVGLSLTALYNVLAALRSGRPFSRKEQETHDSGLVSVLRQLHDQLDDEVAVAYGWQANLPGGEILARLVALNAVRTSEEAAGQVRWLRPSFQAATAIAAQPQLGITPKGTRVATNRASKARAPWPKSLAERVQAVERALQSATHPVTAEILAARFARANTSDVVEILDTLATLGRAHREGDKFTP